MHIQHDEPRRPAVEWQLNRHGQVTRKTDPRVWERDDSRRALAEHDICTAYRLLQRFGISQRQIAAMTQQSQSEISEIIGGRQVWSYAVLVRICEGLNLPRGWMGLAYNDDDSVMPAMT